MAKKFFPLLQIFFLSTGMLCWQLVFKFVEEADTYFVMNLGRYILENGFPHVDPFTVHENLRLVAQQWLSGIVFWEVYKNFGVEGLLLTDCVVGAAAVLIYWRLCLFVSGGNKILSFAMSFVLGILIAPMIVPRPHILSAVLLLIEVFFLEKFTRTEDAKFLIPLPLVSLALVNFHAAVWLMSLVLCLPFLFVKNLRHVKFLLAAMLGIFLCGLINPYGVEAMTYVFRSYGVEIISENIPEMFTPSAHGFQGKFFFLVEALLIFSLAKFKAPWRYILLSGGLTFMAIMHGRNLILFYLIATLPIAFAWKNFSVEKFKSMRVPMTIFFFLVLFVNTGIITIVLKDYLQEISLPLEILFFATTLFALYTLLVLKVDGRIIHPAILPRKNLSLLATGFIFYVIFFVTISDIQKEPPHPYTDAIKFLLRSERPENISLYAPQGAGGLAGSFGIKYYIDSRSEVFIDANNGRKNIFEEYVDFTSGKIYYKDFFKRYNFTHAILTSNESFLFNQLSDDKNFRVIYESERVEKYKVVRCKIFVPPKNGD